MGCDVSDPLKTTEELSASPKYPEASSACRMRGTRGGAAEATGAWRDSTSSSNNTEARSCRGAGALVHPVKLSVGMTGQVYLLETEGLFTQGSRPGRTVDGSVGGVFLTDFRDWSNGIQYQIFDTRPDTKFNFMSEHLQARRSRRGPGRLLGACCLA